MSTLTMRPASTQAPVMPAPPHLDEQDLRLARYVLARGSRAHRRAQTGLRVRDVQGAAETVRALLGATHLPQAAALVAAHRLITPAEVGLPPAPAALPYLVPRVRRAQELLLSGLDTMRVAERLGVTPDTARGYLCEAVRELGAGRRPQAAFLAVAYDLVPLSVISPRLPSVVLSAVNR